MAETEPFISVVAVGRNDNYGGDFKARLQTFVTWTYYRLGQIQTNSELVFVNYNPMDDVPIETFIQWPKSNDKVSVRIITVPSEVHRRTVDEKGVKDVPVLEYVAKNIGIRRAKGQFVMAMNPDVLISSEIFDRFNQLSDRCYYRANRLDYSSDSEVEMVKSLYSQLSKYVKVAWFKGRCYDVEGVSRWTYSFYRFRSALSNRWRRLTVYLRPLLDFLSVPVYYDNIEYRYHCNASGDFMLMHRDAWDNLKGYSETSYISLHVDSLMVIQAAFSGLSEVVFCSPIYHKEHERRFDAVKKSNADQQLVYKRFKEDVESMVRTGEPLIYNDDDWGLEVESLPEEIT